MLDDNRPILTITTPSGANGPNFAVLIGMHDTTAGST